MNLINRRARQDDLYVLNVLAQPFVYWLYNLFFLSRKENKWTGPVILREPARFFWFLLEDSAQLCKDSEE